MVKITEIDMALREDLKNDRFDEGVYFIESRAETLTSSKIIPCSPSKISASNVVYLKPHARILPVGFMPMAKAVVEGVNRNINKILDSYIKRAQKEPVLIPVESVEYIIEEIYKCLIPDDDTHRFISKAKMICILRYLLKDAKQCYVVVRRDRNMQKYRESGAYIDSPDNGKDERKLACKVAEEIPCLMLLHEKGNNSCWKFREFWWPILVVPKKTPKTIYALSEQSTKVRK